MCSVPMKLWLRSRASSCANTSTLRARSVKRSKMYLSSHCQPAGASAPESEQDRSGPASCARPHIALGLVRVFRREDGHRDTSDDNIRTPPQLRRECQVDLVVQQPVPESLGDHDGDEDHNLAVPVGSQLVN